MRLKNTSRYPTAEVRALVAFGMRGVSTARVAVHVKNATCDYRGRAYNGTPGCSPTRVLATVDRLVTLGVGPPEKFPTVNHYSRRLKSVPEQAIRDWREALVRVAAHEARHLYQFQHRKRRSEVDCERFAAKRLNEWRKQEGEGEE